MLQRTNAYTQDVLYYHSRECIIIFCDASPKHASKRFHHDSASCHHPLGHVRWCAYAASQQSHGGLPALTKLFEVDEFPTMSEYPSMFAVGPGMKEPVLPNMLIDFCALSAGGCNNALAADHNVEEVYWVSRVVIVNLFTQLPNFASVMRPGGSVTCFPQDGQ